MHSRTVVGEGLLWAKGHIILLSLNVFGDVHPKTRIWRGDHNLPLDKQWLNSFPIYPCLGVSWVTCYWPLSETETQAGSHLYHLYRDACVLAGCLTQSVTGMGWRSGMDKQTKCVIIVPLCRSAELRWSMDRLLHYHLRWLIDLMLVAPRSNRKPIHFEIVSIQSSSLSHHSP